MSDRVDLQRLLTSGESVVRLGGRYYLDGPLLLPDWPMTVQGDGIESTELVFQDGCDGFIGRYSTFYTNCPLTLKNLTLGQRGIGGTAVSLTYPPAASVNEPTAYLEKLSIRPSPTLGTSASWHHGIKARNAWNMRIRDCTIHGDNAQWQPTNDTFSLRTAISLSGSTQDCQISGLLVYGGVESGILIEATALGEGEGLLISEGAIVGARTCIRAISTLPNGWPTPWIKVSGVHLYHHDTAILLVGRSQAAIIGNNICASAQTQGGVGVYVAGGSRNAKIVGNDISTMSYRNGYAVVVDASDNIVISDNTVDTHMGVWMTPSAKNCRGSGNAYGFCPLPVVDQGVGNRVERAA